MMAVERGSPVQVIFDEATDPTFIQPIEYFQSPRGSHRDFSVHSRKRRHIYRGRITTDYDLEVRYKVGIAFVINAVVLDEHLARWMGKVTLHHVLLNQHGDEHTVDLLGRQ